MKLLISFLFKGFLVLVLALLALRWAADQPIPVADKTVHFSVEQGMSLFAICKSIRDSGVRIPAPVICAGFRMLGAAKHVQVGYYEIDDQTSFRRLAEKLVRGESIFYAVTFPEGWTWQQMRHALSLAPYLKQDTASWSDQQIMQALGHPELMPEGQFFPDTYRYSPNTSDLVLLTKAFRRMQTELNNVWQKRRLDLPLDNPEEVLVLASLIEKETGDSVDRNRIASVFHNRLRMQMRLQTDPAVIYGLGNAYDGKLHKRDLERDTPYNTYTRSGLPPTPIAMPGLASLIAATQAEPTSFLYFVSRGDGKSAFSQNLTEHNTAVYQYQLHPTVSSSKR